jgi:hypothetical protein
VCGCDGVSYWTDCLRKKNGVSLRSGLQCTPTVAAKCGGQIQLACPTGTDCGMQYTVSTACSLVYPEGICWKLPDTCGAVTWYNVRSCSAQTEQCLSKCAAIKQHVLSWYDNSCPQDP